MKWVSTHWKHTLLDYAHPIPSITEIHVGKSTSVLAILMEEMMASMDSLPNVILIPDSNDDDTVTIEVDDDVPVKGVLSAVRFLGRLSRLYPITPESALLVDSNLERLGGFLPVVYEWCRNGISDKEAVTKRVTEEMEWLESRFDDNEIWIEGFGDKTIADVCWTGVIRWVVENDLWDADATTSCHENLACWWSHVRPEYVDEEEDE